MIHKAFFENLYCGFVDTEEFKKFIKITGCVHTASQLKIAIAGSTAIHIASKKPTRVPSDIDFVTDNGDLALKFILNLIINYEKYRWYGDLKIQNKTNFCFEGTSKHYKLKTSFGINICVMVLNDKLNYWVNDNGIVVQKFDDVIKFAKIASSKDGKNRPEINDEN